MTQAFTPAVRRLSPAATPADIVVAAPPDIASANIPGLVARLLPVVMSVASMGVMAAALGSGSAVTRSPMFLTFPAMMLASMIATAVNGRGRLRGGGIDADRVDYLRHLSELRSAVAETAAAQQHSAWSTHPDPDTLWTLVGGPRMWERGAGDADFCRVRVGVGVQPLATRLLAPDLATRERRDPVTTTALRRFLQAHSTVVAPIAVDLLGEATVTVEGEPAAVRGLLRAVICQLAVLHPPDRLLIVGVVDEGAAVYWDWLKWLPHNQHPSDADAVGAARMVYRSPAQALSRLAGIRGPHVVVVADLAERVAAGHPFAITGATILQAGGGGAGTPLAIRRSSAALPVSQPDRMDALEAEVCARRLARYHADPGTARNGRTDWPGLTGIGDVARFDPIPLWRGSDRLRVPLGTTADGAPLELDIKEPAQHGMGPHGLCVGATGSGKSELLRTIALGMMARNSPEALNLLLVDFKGGATFLEFAAARHVAAVITNLAEEAPLVARMRDALAGEMNRRQQLLRAAHCVSVAAYQRARRDGDRLLALPTLFIIVDEFSELLSQHPDFADMFVAIGRLGRSLGMHLLLASQRLDEGRLRGLDAHLSYRICLKTLSAGESRAVLGTADAYQLPNTPGAGLLRAGTEELTRFQAAFVSGPLPAETPRPAPTTGTPPVRVFSARPAGPVTRLNPTGGPPSRTVLRAVLDRLAGHGPPAHQVWLPPLRFSPALDALLRDAAPAPELTIPIGVVDRPLEQRRTPLMVDLSGAAGNVAIVGAPQSGKSTALWTLITGLAATHHAGRVQFYCLDFGGGTLASTRRLPHVGAVAGRAEPRLAARIVAECESIVRSREAVFTDRGIGSMAQYRAMSGDDPFGDVFLVVDGWATLRHEFADLETSITALAAQGLSLGVHVVLSASRWAEIRPSLKDQIGTRIELRLGDPADSELDRKAARDVPHDKPGRGLSRDGLHMAIALPTDRVADGDAVAPPIALLPEKADLDTVIGRADDDLRGRILLGLDERGMRPIAVDFERHAHLLILGDNQCGKTATLRALCREIIRTKAPGQAMLLIVDYRRSLLGVVESEHLAGYAVSATALNAQLPRLTDILQRRMPPPDVSQAQLRTRSWWSGPELYVVVDDYDLVAAPAGNPLTAIVEYLPYADDLGLHLIVARRSGGAERALFEPLLATLRDLGCMALMMSRGPDDGAPFGAARPARMPPGRGVLHTRGADERLLQVAWSPP